MYFTANYSIILYFRIMVLVTGGTGLIGSHLLYCLCKKGIKIRAFKRPQSDLQKVKQVFSYYQNDVESLFQLIEWVDGDVLDYWSVADAMKEVSQVYHCAALVYASGPLQKEMLETNIQGTTNMVNAALEHGQIKFCHVSSTATLPPSAHPFAKNDIITETNSWQTEYAASDYSLSKYAAEKEVWRASEEGLDIVVVNPGIVIGPGNWNSGSSSMISLASKGLPYYTDGGTGFVGVTDVVHCMVNLMEGTYKNERYILVAENLAFRHFFDLAQTQFGKSRATIHVGKLGGAFYWRLAALGAFFTKKSPTITKETAHNAQVTRRYSNTKITKTLGFEFKKMEEVIIETCKHLQTELEGA